ncbi:MAG: hypothetical protein ACKVP5_18290 [Aestuariivirga sp.]
MLIKPSLRLLALVLAIWCMGAIGANAAGCETPKRPVQLRESTWYCYRDSDTVIVFVHGILSDNVSSWTNDTVSPAAFWPEIVLQDSANFGEPAIFLAAYPTGVNGGEYDIDSAAQAVLSALRTKIDGREKKIIDFNRIVFVSHSLGGIVSRRLVMLDQANFASKRIAFTLVASPSRGTDFNYYFKLLSQVTQIKNKLNDQMSFKNVYVEGLDSQFRQFIEAHRQTVIGAEFFEQLPLGQSPEADGLFSALGSLLIDEVLFGKQVLSRPVVSMEESYGKYWGKKDTVIPGTDHWTIAKPYSIDAPSHRALADFYANFAKPLFESKPANCPELEEIGIRFNVKKYKNRKWPVITFLRIPDENDDEGDFDTVFPQASSGKFNVSLSDRLPCPGKEMRAELALTGWQGQDINSFAVTQEEQDAIEQYQMSLCFKRSTDLAKDKPTAFFDCKNPDKGQCRLNVSETKSLAENCDIRGTLLPFPEGIRLAQNLPFITAIDAAQEAADTAAKMAKEPVFWVTPSLASIARREPAKRISYTEFIVRAEDLPKAASEADRFSATVLVNDVPVRFDGIDPERMRRRISGRESVSYQFGLDPLNFNGAFFGYEQIVVKFNFYDGKRRVHTAYSRRPYAASRNYADSFNDLMKRLTYDNGGTFSWSGTFRPGGTGQDRYAILLQSAKSEPDLRAAIDKMEAGRMGLQSLGLAFDGKPVEGRLAAPRPTNSAVGLTLVLKLDSGRTQGAFPLATAEKLCRFIMRHRTKLISVNAMTPDAVIYDYDPALYTKGRDIGRFRRTCAEVSRSAKS